MPIKIRRCCSIALVAAISSVQAHEAARITVVSELSRTPIPQAMICFGSGLDTCAYTDDSGFAAVSSPESSFVNCRVGASGYLDTLISVFSGPTARLTIALKAKKEDCRLPTTVIRAAKWDKRAESYSESSTRFTPAEIKEEAGAAEDIGRYIGTLPSTVASIGEGYDNTFYVRGGRPSETTFLVDGIEMENIDHFSKANGSGGPISFVNTDNLESVDFYAGNIPVSEPSRLSSVVDIHMKTGSFSESKGLLGCKLTGGVLSVEGPLAARKSSFSLAGRYVDFTPLRSFIQDAGIPKLGDLYAKLAFLPGADLDVSATGIFSYNSYNYEYPFVQQSDEGVLMTNAMNQNEHIFQGGAGIALRFKRGNWEHEAHASFSFRNGTNGDSLASFTDPFFLGSYARNPVSQNRDDRRHLLITTASRAALGNGGAVSFGIRVNGNDYSFYRSDESKHEGEYISCNNGMPDTQEWLQNPMERSVHFSTMESGGHLDYCQTVGDFSANGGFRADYYHALGVVTVSPRLSASYKRERLGTLTASLGLYSQFPTDMPSNIFDYFSSDPNIAPDTLQALETRYLSRLLPQRCWQGSCGWEKKLLGSLKAKAEAYYKWYDREYNYVNPSLQDMFAVNPYGAVSLQEQNGRRKAYGIELTAENHGAGSFYYSLAGSLFDVSNRYADGSWRDDWTDVRYTYSLAAGLSPIRHHNLSASIRGAGGRPLCAQTIAVDCQGRKSVELDTTEPYFSRRLDPLLTVNAKYSLRYEIAGKGLEAFVEVLNLFNYKPTLEYRFNGDHFIDVKPFGITPIIGCSLQW